VLTLKEKTIASCDQFLREAITAGESISDHKEAIKIYRHYMGRILLERLVKLVPLFATGTISHVLLKKFLSLT